MKKLIAISVLFALLAVGAFAEVGVSGTFRAHWNLVNTNPTNDTTSDGGVDESWLQLTAENDEGTIGAQMRFHPTWAGLTDHWAWWKPIPQLTVGLGGIYKWGYDGLVGWGFHEGGADYGHMEGYSFGAGNAGDFGGGFNFYLSLNPIDGLEIDLGIPIPGAWWEKDDNDDGDIDYTDSNEYGPGTEIADAFKVIYVQGSYDIGGIGKATLVFKSSAADGEIGTFGLGFNLTAIENVPVILLVKFDLKEDSDLNTVGVSIGAGFSSGDFGVRFRAASTFVKDGDFNLHAQIMPFYNLGIFTAYLNLGLQVGKDYTRFYLNPYIIKSIGAGKVALGIQLDIAEGTTKFALPLTISYSF